MTERKFSRGLRKPGMAAQMRETVSQVVRESAAQTKPLLVEPLDYETFIAKNKTLLQNDPQRELLLYPPDDVSQIVLPRKYRTINQNLPSQIQAQNCTLFTRECIKSYTANWNLIHYKYSAYSGSYLELPKILKSDELKDEVYEVDTDFDQVDESPVSKTSGLTKQGYLMKGPEVGSDRMFVNIGSKSFKRRFCFLRQEVDGTYILELHKDDKKGEAKATIVMDFCTEVVRNVKRGRYCFELHMTAGHKSYCLAADSEVELLDWISKLQLVIQQIKAQEEKRAASLERTSTTPVASPQQHYGTLKGLEQSVNPQLMKYARETDVSIAIGRKDNRRRLYSVYPFMPHLKSGSPTSCPDNSVEPYKEQFGLRFIVRCETLKFRLQASINGEKDTLCQVEPYFTTLALYDAKEGRKLSEDFHFDVNSPLMQALMLEINSDSYESMLPEDLAPKEWLHQQRCAVMSVSKAHSEIYLVIRIDKILQGGVCQTAEPYIRSAKDPRLGLKVHRSVKASCQRLGKYRMPFVWSARPIFRLYSNELDTSSDFPALYRQDPTRLNDDEIIKILAEYRKPDKLNKLTVIPGWIQVKVEPFSELPENSLTCTLTPLKPFPTPPLNGPSIEIAELHSNPHPFTYLLNNLYIYPLSLIFDSQKAFTRARNIACLVELRDSDEEAATPIKCIFGRLGELLSSQSCYVLHHTTNPTWYNEIKIKLPIKVTPQHHILFTFKHISIEGSKKKETGPETNVGYAWLPLLHKGRLNVEHQSLPVAANLPTGYLAVQPLGLGKGFAGPEIMWIDGQKPIFSVKFHLMSTVFTTDLHLHNLFAHSEKLQEPKNAAISPSESETCKILKAAHAIQLSSTISFLPTLLNQLFGLLVRSTSCEIGINVIRLLVHLVHLVQEAGASDALSAYVKYVFVGENVCSTTVHEELCSHLPSLLHPDNTDFLLINKFLPHSGFFFQIMVKSMAQHLLTSGRIKMHRNERFSLDFISQMECLLQVLTPYLASKHKEMPNETQQLNSSIANFLKKCLTFMDRGFVFRLINYHIASFGASESRVFQDMKFTFLQIITSHEHYVVFNLPMLCNKIRQDLTSEYYLSEEFCRYHFLVGLVLQETKAALNLGVQTRKLAITCLRDLLAKHELDDRYQAKGQLSRIASLYLPWLAIVLENLNHLITVVSAKQVVNYPLAASNGSLTSSIHSPLRRYPHNRNSLSARASLNLRDSTYFAAIAGQTLVNGNSSASLDSDTSTMSGDNASSISQETAINQQMEIKTHSRSVSGTQAPLPRFDKLLATEVKDILICFLFVLKHLSQEQLISWWHHCSESDILGFFKAIELSLHEFKYTGRREIAAGKTGSMTPNEAELSNGVAHRQPGPVKAMTLPARMQPPDFSSNDSKTSHAMLSACNSIGRENIAIRDSETSFLYQALMEANLATEVGLIVLDALGLYCLHFRDILMCHDGDNPIMKPVFDLYLSFLQVGQSETLFRHVFAALRAFINNFSLALYQGNAVLCGRLCLELLRCCNSRLSAIRQEACAILYLLMRSNFEFSNRKGLTRVHLQVIISVSQLLGSILGLNNARFQESLSLINSYASSDKVMKGTGFPGEVKDLMKRIRTVLMATAQMRELHHDPEMLTDLQHSLAISYAHTPELRFTWLQTMSRNHVRDKNLSEAACCQLHIGALMAQYLRLKGAQEWGAEAFEKISSNIPRDEMALKLDCGIQEIQYSEQSLLEQLETCSEYLEKAERYECLGELYRLIVPIYESRRDFQALTQAYQTLAQAYNKVQLVSKSGKRLLGRFYKVGLFGQAYFEEEHGIEYIYKEPKVTTLSEMFERLFNQYSNKFGPNTVKIIMDSAPLNSVTLDPKLAHIQITHVTPYFEKDELELRQTEFEQNHDINQFMFEIPFTKDGRPRGNPDEQWKQRCILKTNYSFPYVKKRQKVASRREIELSPIEVALDEMVQRVTELEEVVFTKPTDAKKLQLRLQGSICVQVNAGPLAYATAFLSSETKGKYSDEKVEELKDVYREFVRVCYAALQLNSQVVRSDQTEYQAALRQNFQKLCLDLSEIFGETLWPDQELGSFKRNSQALFSAISGANSNSSSA